MVFWLGDLNYRIQVSPEMTAEQVKALADNYQLPTLLKYDQLLQEMAKKTVFLGFTEGHITFKPTYKYNVNSDEWDRYGTGTSCYFSGCKNLCVLPTLLFVFSILPPPPSLSSLLSQ